MSDSIVLQLQQEAMNSNSDILNLLRKAFLVAKKLHIKEFEQWLNQELNGYNNLEEIPDYRKIKGALKAYNSYYGWINVITSSREEKFLSKVPIYNPIASLKDMCFNNSHSNQATLQLNGELNQVFCEMCDFRTQYAIMFANNQICDIIEKVKNVILEWSLNLESNGILGEHLRFSDDELSKVKGNDSINNVSNYYSMNFFGSVKNTQIQQSTNGSTQLKI